MHAQVLWPRTLRQWLVGLYVSVPVAILLLSTRSADGQWAALAASFVVVLSIPWVVPATMLFAVLSAPVYMWLHTQGPVPAVLDWLGGVVLVAAVAGSHLNGALVMLWQRTRKAAGETGLRDFLLNHQHDKS